MAFTLHPQLAADTIHVTQLALCTVRLMNDRSWPWLVLVPARHQLTELFELEETDRHALIDEVALASTVLRDLFQPHKINVAALGNQVSQLHIHVIARFSHDPAWPRPIWGVIPPTPYRPHEHDTTIRALQDAFARVQDAFQPSRRHDGTDYLDEERSRTGVWSFFGFTDR